MCCQSVSEANFDFVNRTRNHDNVKATKPKLKDIILIWTRATDLISWGGVDWISKPEDNRSIFGSFDGSSSR